MFVNTVSLPGRFTVSGFLGPERSDNHGSFVVGGGTGTSEPFGNWSLAGSAQSLKSATLKAELERNLGKNIGFQAGYEHDFQDQIGTADPALQGGAHRNRFYVTL